MTSSGNEAAAPALFSFIISTCIVLVLVILALFGWDFYSRVNKPIPNYYMMYEDKPILMTPLSQPNFTTNAILHWATNAATFALTFNFFNYNDVLKKSRVYFTPTGYDKFLGALKNSHTLQSIISKKLAVYAVQINTPVVLMEGPIAGGIYAWQIQIPMLLTYESEKANKQEIIISLLVTRVPTSQSVTGIGIASFVVSVKK